MSKFTHVPKLTRTACGKIITSKITLGTDPNEFRWRDKVHCFNCCVSGFTHLWSDKIVHLKFKFNERFGNFPENSLIMDAAHKKAIEEYQDKGFNV